MRFSQFMFQEMAMQNINGLALFEAEGLLALYHKGPMRQRLLKQDVEDIGEDIILAALSHRDNTTYQVREVDSVVAKHGYGPAIYMIAMQTSPNGLAPNRTGKVSPDAKQVWRQFYDGAGAHLVNKVPMTTEVADGVRTATHFPGEDFMDMKYTLKQPVFNLSPLRALNRMTLANDPYQDKLNHLWEAIEGFLTGKMQTVWNDDN